jgi:hypothetical protein
MRGPAIQLTLTDIVANLVLARMGLPHLRATRVLRPLQMACTHRQVRRALRNIRRCLPGMFTMVSLLLLYIGVTTVVFFALFQHRCGMQWRGTDHASVFVCADLCLCVQVCMCVCACIPLCCR